MSDQQEPTIGHVNTEPRIRVNTKQTAKGEFYFDVTAEIPEADPAKVVELLATTVSIARERCRSLGWKLAGETANK